MYKLFCADGNEKQDSQQTRPIYIVHDLNNISLSYPTPPPRRTASTRRLVKKTR